MRLINWYKSLNEDTQVFIHFLFVPFIVLFVLGTLIFVFFWGAMVIWAGLIIGNQIYVHIGLPIIEFMRSISP